VEGGKKDLVCPGVTFWKELKRLPLLKEQSSLHMFDFGSKSTPVDVAKCGTRTSVVM
jgi:hypothetical protein